jgi:hypothetical protein
MIATQMISEGDLMAAQNMMGQVDCLLTNKQVSEILTEQGYSTTTKVVWHLDRQVLNKLANDPLIEEFAEDIGLQVDPHRCLA